MKKKILLGLLAVFVLIQLIPIEKNDSGDETNSISKKYIVPENVATILKTACNDCHSNQTTYPWYSKIQPAAGWLAHHVDEGKSEINFSSFITRPIAVQNHKFEEIVEQVEKKEMPLPSYTYLGLHKEANLTDEQRKTLVDWAKVQMDSLKAQYPADSLILKRKSPPPAK